MNSHFQVVGQKNQWENLLEGNTLDHFVQLNGKADFTIEDGILIGTSKSNTPNSFLATKKIYEDFYGKKISPDSDKNLAMIGAELKKKTLDKEKGKFTIQNGPTNI